MGANEVTSSVSIDAAMIQWNARAANEWRFTFAGTRAANSGLMAAVSPPAGFGQNATYSVWATMNTTPNASATQTRFHCAWVRISSLQGFSPRCTNQFMT